MKTILFLSRVTSRSFLGKESVSMEMAFSGNTQLPGVRRGALFGLSGMDDAEFGSTTKYRLPKTITQKSSHWARSSPLLEVSRPHLFHIKDKP